MAKHTNAEHAPYAPSGFEKLLECPGSAILEKGEPNITNPNAQTGEFAHDIWEHCVYNPKTMDTVIAEKTHEDALPDFVEAGEVEDLKTHPKNFALYLLGLQEKLQPFRFEIEQRVELIPKKVWGRQDAGFAYYLKGNEDVALAVIDYKHGFGSVQAEGNWQLIIYALAFAKKLGVTPKKATLVIYQPRVYGEEAIRRVTYTWDAMLAFEKRIKKAVRVADRTLAGEIEPKFKAGKHCQFCKAKYKCKTYGETFGVDVVVEVAETLPVVAEKAPFPPLPTLTDEQIVKFLKHEKQVTDMFKAMRAYLIQRAIAKNPVPGTKLVEGRTNRRWNGKPSEIAEYLETLGIEEPIETVLKLKGIGQIEAEIAESLDREEFKTAKARQSEAWKLLQSVVIKPEGKISIALEDDPKPAITLEDGRLLAPEDLITDL